jgi:hypothetical protein
MSPIGVVPAHVHVNKTSVKAYPAGEQAFAAQLLRNGVPLGRRATPGDLKIGGSELNVFALRRRLGGRRVAGRTPVDPEQDQLFPDALLNFLRCARKRQDIGPLVLRRIRIQAKARIGVSVMLGTFHQKIVLLKRRDIRYMLPEIVLESDIGRDLPVHIGHLAGLNIAGIGVFRGRFIPITFRAPFRPDTVANVFA